MDLFTDRLRYKQTNHPEKNALATYFVNTTLFRSSNPYTALMFFIDSKIIDPSIFLFRFDERINERVKLVVQLEKKEVDKKNFQNSRIAKYKKVVKIPYEDEEKIRQKILSKELDRILTILFSMINVLQ